MSFFSRTLFMVLLVVAILVGGVQSVYAASWVGGTAPVAATWYGIAAWDTNNVVMVGESEGGVIYKSIDQGVTWSSKISQTNPGVYDVTRVPGTLGAYAVGRHAADSAFMLYAANKGTGWDVLVPTGINPFADLYGVSFASQTMGWVVGSSGLIYKTTDASNWTLQTSGVGTTLRDVDFVDANNGWAVGDSNVVVRTTNGGATWNSVSPGVSANLYGVDFVNATTGWVVGSNGTILYTTNGGTSWTTKSPEEAGPSIVFRGVTFLDVQHGMFIGSGGNVFVTTDGGTTIAKESMGASPYLYAVAYVNASDRYVVGQNSLNHYDALPPTVTLILNPLSATANVARSFVVGVSDSVSSIASCNFFVNNVDKGSMSIGNLNASITYTFTDAGTYSAYARCVDTAGNAATGPSVTVTVTAPTPAQVQSSDVTPPQVGQIYPLSTTTNTAQVLNVSIFDSQSSITSCQLFINGGNMGSMNISNNALASTTYTFASAGTYSVYARCMDVWGNIANGTPVSIIVYAVYTPAPDTTVSVSASTVSNSTSSTVAANGSDSMYIMVYVRNSGGYPLAGKSVALNSSRPGYDTVVATQGTTTNSLGLATFLARSTVAGTSQYTAFADGVLISQLSVVQYIAPTSPSSSSSSSSGGSSSSPFVSCTTFLCPGDLIRGTMRSPYGGYPVYYFTADRKKSLFPNEITYKTWYSDFSAVKVLSQTELESIPGADKNVTVRPGTSVVRFESDSALYVIEPGAIIRKIDAVIGNAIYGAYFPILSIEVAFRANYRAGTPVSSTAQFNRTTSFNASPTIAVEMVR